MSLSNSINIQEFIESSLPLLTDTQPLTRKIALDKIQQTLSNFKGDKKNFSDFCKTAFLQLVTSDNWITKQSGFNLATIFISNGFPIELDRTFQDIIRTHLDDEELLVRISLVDLLSSISKIHGLFVWNLFGKDLLSLVHFNFNRNPMIIAKRSIHKKTDLLHHTEGYHALDSSLKVIMALIRSIGKDFLSVLDIPMVELLYSLLEHPNRFVRETSFRIFKEVFDISDKNTIEILYHRISLLLSKGLIDDWGHVSLAASESTRSFLLSLLRHNISFKDDINGLIPTLCSLRYINADGIKRYTNETWSLIFKGKGKDFLLKYIDSFIQNYLTNSNIENTSIREAVCLCIGELFLKVGSPYIDKYKNELLIALNKLLKDYSWTVRDAACISLRHYFDHYYYQINDHDNNLIKDVLKSLLDRSSDRILSIRENASSTIISLIKTNKEEYEEVIIKYLNDAIIAVKDQPIDQHIHLASEDGYGPKSKELRDNNPKIHINQEIFSCECHTSPESCLIHHINKNEPWQITDGALYIFKDLLKMKIITNKDSMIEIIKKISMVASMKKTFAHHHTLMNSLFEQLIDLCRNYDQKEILEEICIEMSKPVQILMDDSLTEKTTKSIIKDFMKHMKNILGQERYNQLSLNG